MLRCGHGMHASCLLQLVRNECPLCRLPVMAFDDAGEVSDADVDEEMVSSSESETDSDEEFVDSGTESECGADSDDGEPVAARTRARA